jgi:hypothetical protein
VLACVVSIFSNRQNAASKEDVLQKFYQHWGDQTAVRANVETSSPERSWTDISPAKSDSHHVHCRAWVADTFGPDNSQQAYRQPLLAY